MWLCIQREINVYPLCILIQIKEAAWFSLAELPGEPLFNFLPFLLEPQGTKIGRQVCLCEPCLIPTLFWKAPGLAFFFLIVLPLCLPVSVSPSPSLSYMNTLSSIGQCEPMKNETGVVATLMKLIDPEEKIEGTTA